jgi:hypothetical protein
MAKRLGLAALLALVGVAVTAPGATAKGLTASVQGATGPGLPHRYVAIAPNSPYKASWGGESDRFTVVARIDKRGGRVGRWWYLPGRYSIPAAAFDDTAGGLSTDGSTLVLSRFSWIYPPRTTGLAVIHTERRPLRPRGGDRPFPVIDDLHLPGSFSFDAISPDGSTIYLIEHLSPVFGGAYRVRALETKSGELLPQPIVDPAAPEERMEGVAISRATSPDGRWAYTLYSGYESRRSHADRAHEPFVHALDTVAGRAVCIDLPQLESQEDPFLLTLRTDRRGRRLVVLNRRPAMGGSHSLLDIDTRSFEVRKPNPVATASSGVGPWPAIAALSAIAAALLVWIGVRPRRPAHGGEQLEKR